MNQSIKLGNFGEQRVIQFLTENGIKAEKENDYNKRYDHDLICSFGRKKFTIEVKFDAMACKTGNLAIEYWNSKKDEPSGITSTKSTFYIYLIRDDTNTTIWLTKTKDLKDFLADTPPFRIVEGCGDENADLMLYKTIDILDKVFHRLETLSKDEVQKVFRKLLKG